MVAHDFTTTLLLSPASPPSLTSFHAPHVVLFEIAVSTRGGIVPLHSSSHSDQVHRAARRCKVSFLRPETLPIVVVSCGCCNE